MNVYNLDLDKSGKGDLLSFILYRSDLLHYEQKKLKEVLLKNNTLDTLCKIESIIGRKLSKNDKELFRDLHNVIQAEINKRLIPLNRLSDKDKDFIGRLKITADERISNAHKEFHCAQNDPFLNKGPNYDINEDKDVSITTNVQIMKSSTGINDVLNKIIDSNDSEILENLINSKNKVALKTIFSLADNEMQNKLLNLIDYDGMKKLLDLMGSDFHTNKLDLWRSIINKSLLYNSREYKDEVDNIRDNMSGSDHGMLSGPS